jgi:hypothetical protein
VYPGMQAEGRSVALRAVRRAFTGDYFFTLCRVALGFTVWPRMLHSGKARTACGAFGVGPPLAPLH